MHNLLKLAFALSLLGITHARPLPTQIAHWREYTGGEAMGISIQGSNAFVAAYDGGLLVFDLTDPVHPRKLTSLPLRALALDITIETDLAFVGTASGVEIIDIANPAAPVPLSFISVPGSVWDVAISWPNAYLAHAGHGIEIFDVSEPSNPARIGAYKTSGMGGAIRVEGNRLFLGDGLDSLKFFDITDAAQPQLVTNYTRLAWPDDIVVNGNTMYVADSRGQIGRLDITDSTRPILRQRGGMYYPYSLLRQGNRLFAGGQSAFAAIDIQGTNFTQVGLYRNHVLNRDLATIGDYVVLASTVAGLQILNASDHANLRRAASYPTAEASLRVLHHDDLALVPSSWAGLVLLDTSSPAPRKLSRYPSDASIIDATLVNPNTAVAALGADGLDIIDISNRTNPVPIASLRDMAVDSVAATNHLLFAGIRPYYPSSPSFLRIFDLSDPTNIVTVGELRLFNTISQIVLSGSRAILREGSSFYIVDISNPAAPQSVSLRLDSINRLTLHDQFVYTAASSSGWKIYDISNPAAPTLVSSNNTAGNVLDIAVANSIAYIADGYSKKVLRYDITSPANPRELPPLSLPSPANSVSIHNDNLYIATGQNGVLIYSLSPVEILNLHVNFLRDPFRIQVLSDAPLRAEDIASIHLQSSPDLVTWTTLPTPLQNTNGLLTFTPDLPITNHLFFRAVRSP